MKLPVLDGFCLHVEEALPPEARSATASTVVLLHSGGLSSRQWKRTSQRLAAEGYHALAPDFLGYGQSSPWPADRRFHLTFDLLATLSLIDARVASGASGSKIHLVGHSYGGAIALWAALYRPSAIASIAVYEPVVFGALGDSKVARPEADPAFLDEGLLGTDAWLRRFINYWGDHPHLQDPQGVNPTDAWDRLPEAARSAFRAVERKVFAEVTSLLADRMPASVYRVLAAPTLLMKGDRSPEAAQEVVRLLGTGNERMQNASIMTFAGHGHMGPLTASDAFDEVLLRHLSGT